MKNRSVSAILSIVCAMTLAGCGSGGGAATPPPPPAPVTPPPPPPEPTFEERLDDLAAHDRNPCRALTPGFEAFGGWIKNDGRELAASRLWQSDFGSLDDEDSHGFRVRQTLDECGVRSLGIYFNASDETVWDVLEREKPDKSLVLSVSHGPARYLDPDYVQTVSNLLNVYPDLLDSESDYEYKALKVQALGNWGFASPRVRPDGGGTTPAGREGVVEWIDWAAGMIEDEEQREEYRELGQGWIPIAEKYNWRLPTTRETTQVFLDALGNVDTALWLLVGGYRENSDGDYEIHPHSSVCGRAGPLCLFAPWTGKYTGTSNATPQVSAGLDAVLAIWPDMPLLDVRNLAMECAEYQDPPEGSDSSTHTVTTTDFTYSTGRASSYKSNEWWGAGVYSLTCLFTPNGGLQDPTTGESVAGGIYGPVVGPITGASITGFDYTGRDFGYGFARPVARPNYALAATANLRPAQAISRPGRPMAGAAAFSGSLWRSGAFGVDLTAAGNAIGAAAGWQAGNWTLRGGLAFQPEGAGSLTGSRAFRAPATASAAITAAYAKGLRGGFSVHLQADHWRTLAAQGRSLWENAELSESRISAGLARRAGRHEVALQAAWQSGVRGALRVAGRDWRLAGIRESGVWLMWRYAR